MENCFQGVHEVVEALSWRPRQKGGSIEAIFGKTTFPNFMASLAKLKL